MRFHNHSLPPAAATVTGRPRTGRRFVRGRWLFAVAALATAMLLSLDLAAAATEAEQSPDPTATPPATAQPSPEATAGGGETDAETGTETGQEEGRTKIELPLGFDDPQEIVGWFFLGLVGLGGALAARNLFQQMRGERSRADGSWRPR